MIIGITGSIGTGKSTISKMFEELGAHFIDYDKLARLVVEPGKPAYNDIVKEFGKEILAPDGGLDRARLGKIVFSDPEKLKKLNKFTHSRIFMEDAVQTEEILKKDPDAIIIKEIPLLSKLNMDPKKLVDKIIVVSATYDVQLKRVMDRGLNKKEAVKRIKSQPPIKETEKTGDYIIYNNGSLDQAGKRVKEVFLKISQ